MIRIKWPWFRGTQIGYGGFAPFAFLHPDYYDNKATIEHERVHNRQCLRGFYVIYWLRYTFSREARYQFELEGYRASYKYGRTLMSCANALYFNHGQRAGRTIRDCMRDLTA